jgi:hypothetical protein
VVTEMEIARERTLGGAMALCAKAAGYDLDKELQQALEVDKAQFSRWHSGQEGISWNKLRKLMDLCGNCAPVLWMLHDLGFDVNSLRKRETELQKELRTEREMRIEAERKLATMKEFMALIK